MLSTRELAGGRLASFCTLDIPQGYKTNSKHFLIKKNCASHAVKYLAKEGPGQNRTNGLVRWLTHFASFGAFRP